MSVEDMSIQSCLYNQTVLLYNQGNCLYINKTVVCIINGTVLLVLFSFTDPIVSYVYLFGV